MGKYLDEIMMMSDKGYIDSFDEIEKLTEKVMNMDARTLTVRDGYKPDVIADDLICLNELPDSFKYTVRICDMLNMAHALSYAGSEGRLYNDCERYAVMTAEILNKASYAYADIKLFLSISVKAFADFMDKRSGKTDRICNTMYKDIVDMAKKNALLDVNEKTTIKAVIAGVRPYMTKWNPRMCVNTFVNYALNCCEIIKKIFVDFIRTGYEDMFDFDKLRENFIRLEEIEELECEKYMEAEFHAMCGEFNDDEELPFDIDGGENDKAEETDEYEQIAIEFQPLSDAADNKSDKKSGGCNNLLEELSSLCEKNKAS